MKKWLSLTTSALSIYMATYGVAEAGPLIGLAAGVFGAIASGAGLTQIILGVALKVGMSLLQMAMTPDAPEQKPVGVKLQVEVGDDRPVSTTIGSYATSGKRKYIGSYGDQDGTPNSHLTEVIELGNIPVSALNGIWIDGEKCKILWDEPVSRGYPIKEYRDDGDDHVWIRFHDGSQTQADQYMRAKFGDHEKRPWTEKMVGRGIPYVVMTYRWNRELLRGQPNCIFELASIPLYDIRKDSSNGGFGPQRWDDPATWEPSLNLAVMTYNVARGLHYKGEWFFGGQNVAAHRLPSSAWIAAAQECGRLIENADGSSAAQFRGGFEITGDLKPTDVLEEFRKGMNARLVDSAGQLKIKAGAHGASIFAFTDDDIIVTEAQGFDPFPPLDQTINGISATYPEPEEQWAAKDAPTLQNDAHRARDRGHSLMASLQYRAVPYKRQVQRLMRAALKEERRFRTHQIWLPPEAYGLEPGIDTVAWTSNHNGYSAKKFLVIEIEGDPTMNQLVTLQEIDPSDYDWSSEFELPTSTGWLGKITTPAQIMQGWSAGPDVITDANGKNRRPAIRVACAPGLDDVARIQVDIRLTSTEDVVFSSDQYAYDRQSTSPSWLVSGDWCLGATDYQVQGKLVPYSARPTVRSAWLDVLTDDIRLSFADMEAGIVEDLQTLKTWIDDDLITTVGDQGQLIQQEIEDRVEAVQAQAVALAAEASARADAIAAQANSIEQEQQARIAALIEQASRFRGVAVEIEALRDYIAENDFAQFQKVEQLRTLLTTRIGQVVATFDEQITLAVSATAALAQRTTTIEVKATGLTAQVLSVESASIDRDLALAYRMDGLSAGTDNQFDPLRIWSFDRNAMGWTGDVFPTVTDGYLRPGNSASPYVASSIGLGVDANTYRQVRARIRKTGNPTWEGHAWWNGTADQAWDSARRVTIEEPSFDAHGLSNITFDMPWTGTVEQIRIDLSVAQSATDYFEFDWISIGSPSPGASRAELLAEQSVRASGDAANAASITALQSLFQDVNGNVTALASGLSTITTTVENLEDSVAAQAQSLTTLNTQLGQKANATALALLSAQVDAINGGGGIVIQGQSTTALRNELTDLLAETTDAAFAAFLGQQNVRNALTTASQTLTTRIEATNDSVDIVSKAVTLVQAALPGKAEASALQTLVARVTATEGSIASSSTAITSLQNAVAGKADASALQSLQTVVTEQGDDLEAQAQAIGEIQVSLGGKASASALSSLQTTVSQQGTALSSQGTAITSLQNGLDGKASASAVSSLQQTVTGQGNTISSQGSAISSLQNSVSGKADSSALQTLSSAVGQQGNAISSQGSAITSLQNALGDKASVSALSNLSTLVSEQGGQITAQATSLQGLSATVGANSADARFKMEVQAGPGGYVRIGARGRVDAGSDYREAGFYLDIPYDGANPTQFLVEVQRFALVANGGKNVPFAVDQNGAYLQSAYIRNITTDQITFKDGSVQDTAVAQNAVAERRFFASADTANLSSVYTNIGSVTIDKAGVDYLEVDAVIRCQGQAGSVIDVRLREGSDNNGVDADSWTFTANNEFRAIRLKYMVDSGSGIRSYSIIARVLSGSAIAGRRTLAAKRDKKSNA